MLEELGIGFVPYSPLGNGFLTGKITEDSAFASTDPLSRIPRFTPDARKANQGLVDLLAAIAERKKATLARSRSPGVLAQNPWIVSIPGTTKLARVEENIGAAAIELTRMIPARSTAPPKDHSARRSVPGRGGANDVSLFMPSYKGNLSCAIM